MSNTATAPEGSGLSDQDRTAVETFYRAFEGDPSYLDASVTEDWEDIPLAPGQEPGREAMKPMIEGFAAAFSNLKVTIHEIIGAPGRAGVRAEISGTHTGNWFGIDATNKSFVLPIHEFHHIENGRLIKTWHLEDWFGWFNQVGAFPPQQEEAS